MIDRPILRYQGSKFRIAKWIISFFPKHEVYVEPYGGCAGVLIQKPPCKTEVYNDINSALYQLFCVLRDKDASEELSRRLYFTPWSREDFMEAYNSRPEDDNIERARKMIIRSFFGNGTGGAIRKGRVGFKSVIDKDGYKAHSHRAFLNYYQQLSLFYERLRAVILENTDAEKIMTLYDTDKTLCYVDPPYMLDLWNKGDKNVYSETLTKEEHIHLLKFLKKLKGYVVVSGYDNAVYNTILSDWHTEEKITLNMKSEERIEKIWISPRTWDKITRRKGLFE